MTRDTAARTATGVTGGGPGRVFYGWWIVATFAITQTVGYGTMYYAFAVLLHPIAADLHASPAAVTGALTTAVLAWAAAAVPVGRWLDRHGGRALMTLGSAGGTKPVACCHSSGLYQFSRQNSIR